MSDYNIRNEQTSETTQVDNSQFVIESGTDNVHDGTITVHADEIASGMADKATGMKDERNEAASRTADKPLLSTPEEQASGETHTGLEVFYTVLSSMSKNASSSSDDDDTLAAMARRRQRDSSDASAGTKDKSGDGSSTADSSSTATDSGLYGGGTSTGTDDSAGTDGSSTSSTASGDDSGIVTETASQDEAAGDATGGSTSGVTGSTTTGTTDTDETTGASTATGADATADTDAAAGAGAAAGVSGDATVGTNVGGIPPKNADGTYDFFAAAFVGWGDIDPEIRMALQATIAKIQGNTRFTEEEARGFQSFLNLVTAALMTAKQLVQTLTSTDTKISEQANALGADLAKQILKCMNETIEKVKEAAEAAKKQKFWGIFAAVAGVVLGAIITAATLGAGAPVGAIIASVIITAAMGAIAIADACTGVITEQVQTFCAMLTDQFNDILTRLNGGKPVNPDIGKILTGILIIAVVVVMIMIAKSPSSSTGVMNHVFGEAGAKIVTSQVVVATIQASVILLTAANSFGELVKAMAMAAEAAGDPWDKDAVEMASKIVQIVLTVLACFMAAKASSSAIEAGAKASAAATTEGARQVAQRITLFASFCEAGSQTATGVIQYKLNELQAKIAEEQGVIDAMQSFLESLQSSNTDFKKETSEALKVLMDAIQTYVRTLTTLRQDESSMASAAMV